MLNFNYKIFTGNSNKNLANNIVKELNISLSNVTVNKFSDGEINIKINENVRDKDIFIIQSICYPSNDNLMELIIMVDALRRASAGRIIAIIPYFGYARQDRKIKYNRVPITAKLIADILCNVGIDKIITVDLHSNQLLGFFDIPIDNIGSSILLLDHIKSHKFKNPIIISPDIGGITRARAISNLLNIDLGIIEKFRKKANVSNVINIIGNIKNRDCILIDDIIDTGGTICNAAFCLNQKGANSIYVYAIHGIYSGNAYLNINNSCIKNIITTDSIPIKKYSNKFKIISLAKLLAKIIYNISISNSISILFN